MAACAGKVFSSRLLLYLQHYPLDNVAIQNVSIPVDLLLKFPNLTSEDVFSVDNMAAFLVMCKIFAVQEGATDINYIWDYLKAKDITHKFFIDRVDTTVLQVQLKGGPALWVLKLVNHTREPQFSHLPLGTAVSSTDQEACGTDEFGYKYYYLPLLPNELNVKASKKVALSDLVGWTWGVGLGSDISYDPIVES